MTSDLKRGLGALPVGLLKLLKQAEQMAQNLLKSQVQILKDSYDHAERGPTKSKPDSKSKRRRSDKISED